MHLDVQKAQHIILLFAFICFFFLLTSAKDAEIEHTLARDIYMKPSKLNLYYHKTEFILQENVWTFSKY